MHHRPHRRPDGLVGLVDIELHPIELLQEIVRELDVGLVDLVDQQHRPLVGVEGFPELAAADVVADVLDPLVAQLAVAQAGDGVVFVEALLGLGGRLDVPGDQRGVERLGDFIGQHGLAGARLALDQQRTFQRDGGVDRDLQVIGRHIVVACLRSAAGSFKFLRRAHGCASNNCSIRRTLRGGPAVASAIEDALQSAPGLIETGSEAGMSPRSRGRGSLPHGGRADRGRARGDRPWALATAICAGVASVA